MERQFGANWPLVRSFPCRGSLLLIYFYLINMAEKRKLSDLIPFEGHQRQNRAMGLTTQTRDLPSHPGPSYRSPRQNRQNRVMSLTTQVNGQGKGEYKELVSVRRRFLLFPIPILWKLSTVASRRAHAQNLDTMPLALSTSFFDG
jgi:hypothetical protein